MVMTLPPDAQTPIIGLRSPWAWVQPRDTAEIKQRLLEARDFMVHERERENMCSVAHGEIERLERELTAERERGRRVREETIEEMRAAVTGGLRATINDHGPITAEFIGSALKRIFNGVEK